MSLEDCKTKATEAENAFKAGLEEWDLINKNKNEDPTSISPAVFLAAADKLAKLHIALMEANAALRKAQAESMMQSAGGAGSG